MRRIALTICAMIIVATGLAGCYSTNSHTESADGTVDSGGPALTSSPPSRKGIPEYLKL